MRTVIYTCLSVAMLLATAIADDGYEAPEIEQKMPWMAILYALVAIAGICVVGFKNSKRTHLD